MGWTFRGAVVFLLAACTPAMLGQDDGFRERLAEGCRTELGCRDLRAEAERRLSDCEANRIGRIRCEDATADFNAVREKLLRLEDQREHAARAARDKQVRIEQAEANERARTEAETERQDRIERTILDFCARSMTRKLCSRHELGDERRPACELACAAAAASAADAEYQRALRACVTGLVDTLGKSPPDCRFEVPDGATEKIDDRRNECSAACDVEARPIVERAIAAAKSAALTPEPAPVPAPAAAVRQSRATRQRPAPSQATRALCCDGSPSPTCECPGHRGCCSHHGGLCGCI